MILIYKRKARDNSFYITIEWSSKRRLILSAHKDEHVMLSEQFYTLRDAKGFMKDWIVSRTIEKAEVNAIPKDIQNGESFQRV